ncbi:MULTISPECIES: hypothetical protein [unclassified Shinella]|uniref:hypothetical protein n=1 Tax=unclassified Shinella TaxID=2643062 RepID=UPI00234F06BF|nr:MULTISPECIES: hypothetical protein [unclassified Shinella]MCO5149616.1 hypothetical protein [Shinella sp.]MDC7262478.1 hypothetical protein [Shinella sp. HY16]MDC7269373.1 hypothetical protein [Shinella sp. YZ44]
MDKISDVARSKEDKRREKKKPGVIVAGPEAHARERAGKAPSGRKPKSADGVSKGTADPS